MKYVIVYLIEGEAKRWHVNLTKTVSEAFGTWKLHEHIPPHITIVRPFETEDISAIKQFLADWIRGRSISGGFTLSGFGHFDDRVVFVKVDLDPSVREPIEGLQNGTEQLLAAREKDFPVWHPHATLAYRLTPPEIQKIQEYVLTVEKPNFPLPFDNVTILRFDEAGQKWGVEESFRFSSSVEKG